MSDPHPPTSPVSESFQESLKTYLELAKSGIVALVLISVLGGYLSGHPLERPLSLGHLGATLLGILLLSAGSSALNQLQERGLDATMPRTSKRPLPSGRLSLIEVRFFVVSCLAGGMTILWRLDPRLAGLGVLAVLSYNGLYTLWWKRKLPFAAVPGAIPGALPIWMGHLASSGELFAPGGLYLFAILFFWQMPHFWSLALRFSEDYAQGGIPTLPVAGGTGITLRQIVHWCLAYCAIALGAPLFFKVGPLYLLLALGGAAWVLAELWRFVREPAESAGKGWLRFFLAVNFSLILFVGAIVIDLWSIYLRAFITR
jgi:protoheme IX farnesyltransferase